MAVPLSDVARLEEFPVDAIECVGGGEVVQYRSRIMPLVGVSHVIGAHVGERPEVVPVVVYTQDDQSVGLVVTRILDVVEDQVDLSVSMSRPGVVGATVLQGRVVEILDVHGAIGSRLPNLFTRSAA